MDWGTWFGLGLALPFLLGFGVPVYRAIKYVKTKKPTVQAWRSFAWLGYGIMIVIKFWGHIGLANGSFTETAFFGASLIPATWASFLIGRGIGTYCV